MVIGFFKLLIFTFLYHITITQPSNIRSNNGADKSKGNNQQNPSNNLPNSQINQNQKGKNNNLPTDQTSNILLNQKNVELNKPQNILDTQLQSIPQNLDLLNFGSISGNIPSQYIKTFDTTPISIPN